MSAEVDEVVAARSKELDGACLATNLQAEDLQLEPDLGVKYMRVPKEVLLERSKSASGIHRKTIPNNNVAVVSSVCILAPVYLSQCQYACVKCVTLVPNFVTCTFEGSINRLLLEIKRHTRPISDWRATEK